ncbi:MAG: DUF4430 domain-containing protein [Clostridia bacterium]|nr:DUF4430 domain-containing protein [Clostridia bacterium]
MKKALSVISLVLVLVLALASCSDPLAGLWDSATYKTDATVGTGANTATVEIKLNDKSVTLTVKTDETTLGAALYAEGIINDPSFFDTCNGMQLVWDETQCYWAFYVNDAYATAGVAETEIKSSDKYTFVCTKG